MLHKDAVHVSTFHKLTNFRMSPSSPYLVTIATEPPSTPVLVPTGVRKYKTTCLDQHSVGANPYNSPEGHHLPGWLPWQPLLSKVHTIPGNIYEF